MILFLAYPSEIVGDLSNK